MKKHDSKPQPKLSVVSALKFFLKGNLLFAISGTTIYLLDIPTRIFPSLFQQVYTDNIITHKNPEWFTPLMALYVLLFVLELSIWILFSVVRRKSFAKIIIASPLNIYGPCCGCPCRFCRSSRLVSWQLAIQAYEKLSSR